MLKEINSGSLKTTHEEKPATNIHGLIQLSSVSIISSFILYLIFHVASEIILRTSSFVDLGFFAYIFLLLVASLIFYPLLIFNIYQKVAKKYSLEMAVKQYKWVIYIINFMVLVYIIYGLKLIIF